MTSRPKLDPTLTTKSHLAPAAGVPEVDLLTVRLNNLSVEERDAALNDLHGIADVIEETPKLIRTKIQEITYALISSIAQRPEESQAYQKALIQSPSYVEDMKIVFLRAEAFDVNEAASRMIRFFNIKKELFGEEKLVKNITQADLGEEERDALQQALQHLLPHRDRAGRAIIFINHGVQDMYPKHETVLRAIFYFISNVLQDEENQIKGIVDVYYAIGQMKVIPGRFPRLVEIARSLPWPLVARHTCWNGQSYLQPLVRFFNKTVERRSLYRFRFHVGTSMECMYSLMTFGIPREALPITEDGSIVLSDHHRVLRILQSREEKVASSESVPDEVTTVFIPGPMDVLMGRGRQPNYRPGLLRMHNLLVEHQEAYDAAPRLKKVDVAKTVLLKMKESGCRFFKEEPPDGYVECDDTEAVGKFLMAFAILE